MKCSNIFEFAPKTWSDYIFGPTYFVGKASGFANLAQSIFTSPSLFDEIIGPANLVTDPTNIAPFAEGASRLKESNNLLEAIKLAQSFDDGIGISSIYSNAGYMFIFGALYRCLNLCSISIQHRIKKSKFTSLTKFLLSSAIAVSPYIIMEILGYSAAELLLSSIFRIVAQYYLDNERANFIRELDLLSIYKNFYITDFVNRNIISYIRNLSSTLLLDINLLWLKEFNGFWRQNSMINVCYIGSIANYQVEAYSSYLIKPIKYFTDELGWSLGRVAVDSFIILLGKLGCIEDLRDPLKNLSLPGMQAKKPSKLSIRLKNDREKLAQAPEAPDKQKVKIKTYAGGIPPEGIAGQHNISLNYTKIKKPKSVSSDVNDDEKKQYNIVFNPLANRTSIGFRVHDNRELVPLSGQHEGNVWGLISRRCPADHFNTFTTSLNAGSIGERSAVKCLSGSPAGGMKAYEIRPKSIGHRLIGVKLSGKDIEVQLYHELRASYPYEEIPGIIDNLVAEMKQQGDKDAELIVFKEFTKHDNISKVVSAVTR